MLRSNPPIVVAAADNADMASFPEDFDDRTLADPPRSAWGRFAARLAPSIAVMADAEGFRFRCGTREERVAAIAHVSWRTPRVLAVGDQAVTSEPSRRMDLFGEEFQSLPEMQRLEWMAAFVAFGLNATTPQGAVIRPVVVAAGLDELPGRDDREFWTRVFHRAGARELKFAATLERRAA